MSDNFISMEYVQTVVTLLCTCRLFLHINQLSARLVTVKRLKKPSGGKTQREKGGGGNKEKKIRNCLRKTSDIMQPVTSALHRHHHICIYAYIYICMYYTRHFLNLGIGTDFLLWKSFFFFCVLCGDLRMQGISFIVSTDVGSRDIESEREELQTDDRAADATRKPRLTP